ncbi:MAG: molybdopterin dinucleotide binding domain-containing protein, partial [Humibacillus sp.]
AVWEVGSLPDATPRDTAGIITAAASGALGALVVGGVDPADLPAELAADTAAALQRAFVVSLELRESAVTAVADVVLPVAPHAEKTGTFVNWEGRLRPFGEALTSHAVSDHRALDMLAAEMGHFLETRTQREINDQLEVLGPWGGARATGSPDGHRAAGNPGASGGAGAFALATWPSLLDAGRMQDGEPFLAGTAPRAVARLSITSAAALGVEDGESVVVTGPAGSLTVPALVTEGMLDGVVWLPTNSMDCPVRAGLGTDAGGRVAVTKGGAA